MSYMTTEAPEPSLSDMTVKALEALSARKKGFFLMVEGGQIDSYCHANNAPGALKQTLDFDTAVGKALEFAHKNRDTLVIVTADHETGGMAIVGPAAGTTGEYSVAFGTKGHSATVVPLLADGPCADRFSGVLDNTDIPKRIAALLGLKVGQLIPAAAK
jgi:alkaline phosphatase